MLKFSDDNSKHQMLHAHKNEDGTVMILQEKGFREHWKYRIYMAYHLLSLCIGKWHESSDNILGQLE